MRLPKFLCVASSIVLAVLGLSGCTEDVAQAIEQDESWTLHIYNNGGVQATKLVGPGTERNELLKWAGDNANGWSLAMQDFVPCLLISGNSFRLNFLPTVAVFSSGPLQYSKSISGEEYQHLRQVLAPKSSGRC
jgi:hypothetical protein